MSRYTGPKARLCRKFGTNIFGSAKYDKILAKKNYAPGFHGKNRFAKKSEFGKQLEEKQKARMMFGLSEKQFKKYYEKATGMAGITGNNLLSLLERRIDNALYRSGFAKTRMQARQLASHGLVKLNGRRITVASIQLKEGDIIEVREKTKSSKLFDEVKKQKDKSPKWLVTDLKNLKFEIKALPDKEDFERLLNSQMIIEFYSK